MAKLTTTRNPNFHHSEEQRDEEPAAPSPSPNPSYATNPNPRTPDPRAFDFPLTSHNLLSFRGATRRGICCPIPHRGLRWLFLLLIFVISSALVAQSPIQHHTAQPAKPANKTAASPIQFDNTTRNSKIDFILKNSVSPQRYTFETMVGGIALFDYNNDGLLDIFFTNGAAIPSLEKSSPAYWNRLYRNNGDGTFTDVTEKAGLQGVGYSMGVAAGDYDNDGFVDLYVTGVNRNQLFHNNGDGTFTDVTAKAGVAGMVPKLGKAWSIAAGWFDYNNDGLLDLFVVNYLNYSISNAKLCAQGGQPAYCSPVEFLGTPNILYRNNGDGTFTDVSDQSHISQYIGKGMGLAFADYDNDGFTDIFIANDTFENYLFRNQGDGTFKNVAISAGVAYNAFGSPIAGMAADFRDVDNDGKPDIFETAMFGEGFPLYKNLGNGQFQDMTAPSGLAVATSRSTAWGVGVFDFDNDGYKDLFTSNSDILDNAQELAHRPFPLPNRVFRNKGSFTFEDVSSKAGPSFQIPSPHRGSAFGDINNDGKVDAVVSVLNGPAELWMNRSPDHNHWLILKLAGVKSNRDGIGTKVSVTTSAGTQYNQASTTVSYNSSSDKRVHFGLGQTTNIDSIELIWPSGIKQVLKNIKPDQILTITETTP
ncbi:MAG TPA: CRTAC1 family protein [Candidatus Eisenbacteria bacterium]|nr:CRTAC1 family protein [Candidatus Eisenbacteria bacterium]